MILGSILKSLLGEQCESTADSVPITDQTVIESFLSVPSNALLVSFPRTGSHWLRMIMELYFHRPSLVRVFYFPEVTDYLTLHTHDIDLTIDRENVIYLYRDPVETIYSQINYYKEDIHDHDRIRFWSDLYGCHLDKWLFCERFTRKKTLITYEGMKFNIEDEFRKLTNHFGEELDRKKLSKAVARVTKEEVKKKTGHDPQVVQLNSDYPDLRSEFKIKYSQLIWEVVLYNRSYLEGFFPSISSLRL